MDRHVWLNFGSNNEMIEITIRDFSGRKLDRFKANNQKGYSKILRHIQKAYGFSVPKADGKAQHKEEVEEEKDFLDGMSWD